MLIANFLKYKHWNLCWVYIIRILTPLVKLFHLDKINLTKHNKQDKNIVMMKSINKRLMKIKHEIKLKHYKERKQENDLDLKTKMPQCMENISFYRLKRTIHLVNNYWLVVNYWLGG